MPQHTYPDKENETRAREEAVPLEELQKEITATIGETIGLTRLQKLVQASTEECIRYHLQHWHIHQQNQRIPGAGYFLTVVENDIKPIAPVKKQYGTSKVPQRDNFDQREYSDEEMEKFYSNSSFDDEVPPSKATGQQEASALDETTSSANLVQNEKPEHGTEGQKLKGSDEWEKWLAYQQEQEDLARYYALQRQPRISDEARRRIDAEVEATLKSWRTKAHEQKSTVQDDVSLFARTEYQELPQTQELETAAANGAGEATKAASEPSGEIDGNVGEPAEDWREEQNEPLLYLDDEEEQNFLIRATWTEETDLHEAGQALDDKGGWEIFPAYLEEEPALDFPVACCQTHPSLGKEESEREFPEVQAMVAASVLEPNFCQEPEEAIQGSAGIQETSVPCCHAHQGVSQDPLIALPLPDKTTAFGLAGEWRSDAPLMTSCTHMLPTSTRQVVEGVAGKKDEGTTSLLVSILPSPHKEGQSIMLPSLPTRLLPLENSMLVRQQELDLVEPMHGKVLPGDFLPAYSPHENEPDVKVRIAPPSVVELPLSEYEPDPFLPKLSVQDSVQGNRELVEQLHLLFEQNQLRQPKLSSRKEWNDPPPQWQFQPLVPQIWSQQWSEQPGQTVQPEEQEQLKMNPAKEHAGELGAEVYRQLERFGVPATPTSS